MAKPHAEAVAASERTARELLALFGRLGTSAHPRGAVLSAYRGALDFMRESGLGAAQIIVALDLLRGKLAEVLRRELVRAFGLGAEQASRMLAAYGLSGAGARYEREVIEQALMATLAAYDDQARRVRAGVLLGLDRGALLGTATRVGVLTAMPVVTEATRWAAAVTSTASEGVLKGSMGLTSAGDRFMRQAIAAVDERTTNCCLLVNGQIVEMENAFVLTGTPRFADRMMQPPFHYYCRTAVALVHQDDTEDDVTEQMRAAGKAELDAREAAMRHERELEKRLADLGAQPDIRQRKGDSEQVQKLRNELRMWRERERVEIHPAHSSSGRDQ